MKLQTNIPFSPAANPIDYASKVLLLGSCFSENIGNKLDYFKFQNLQNPFGILFHPVAMENLIQRVVIKTPFTKADVFERDGQWYSFETHSSITAPSQEKLVALLNARITQISGYLSEASHIVFTFGTAWVYRHIGLGKRVANCHKIPQKNFTKELLTVGEISASIANTIALISEINNSARIVLTVSPIRHSKDGFIENTRSKAHLVSGIHQVVQQQESVFYFPSFEIMMDELRDYRFYTEDMIHPNTTAIGYIWEKFQEVWISPETTSIQKEIDIIQKGLKHKPFHKDSDSYHIFKANLDAKIRTLQKKIPTIAF